MQKASEGYAHVFGNCLMEKEGNLSKELAARAWKKIVKFLKRFLMAKLAESFFCFKNLYLKTSVLMKNLWQ